MGATKRKDSEIIKLLKAAHGPMSGQEIANRMAVSRTAVWKNIEKLRGRGYEIVGSPKVGYLLKTAPDRVIDEDLSDGLPGEFRGEVVCFESVGSTNDIAKDLASAGRFKPAGLVVAEEQASGRGRFRRQWSSPPGGIWMSVLLRPKISASAAARAAILAAVVVAESINRATSLTAGIKWPNDILIEGRKVAGILTEMAAELGLVEYIVIGIGINANIDEADLTAVSTPMTTIKNELGKPVDRSALIKLIASELFKGQEMLSENYESVLGRWKRLSVTIGKDIEAEDRGVVLRGKAIDLDGEGGLIIQTLDGERHVLRAGEVTLAV